MDEDVVDRQIDECVGDSRFWGSVGDEGVVRAETGADESTTILNSPKKFIAIDHLVGIRTNNSLLKKFGEMNSI
jgi:hypothetical protein